MVQRSDVRLLFPGPSHLTSRDPSSKPLELVPPLHHHPDSQPPADPQTNHHSDQVPKTHRPFLQQLHIRLRNPHKRKVPPPPSARRALALNPLLRRRKPPLLRHRGGRPQLLHRSPRELDQSHHEPVLQGGHGGHESCFPAKGCGSGEEVLVGEGLQGARGGDTGGNGL